MRCFTRPAHYDLSYLLRPAIHDSRLNGAIHEHMLVYTQLESSEHTNVTSHELKFLREQISPAFQQYQYNQQIKMGVH
jgi:hypothetical protein